VVVDATCQQPLHLSFGRFLKVFAKNYKDHGEDMLLPSQFSFGSARIVLGKTNKQLII
jgi:hypothetical protein